MMLLQNFVIADKHDFENYEDDNEKFFTCSERQYLIKNLLEHVVCDDDNIKHVVGFEKIKVYKGRPISKFFVFSFLESACYDKVKDD